MVACTSLPIGDVCALVSLWLASRKGSKFGPRAHRGSVLCAGMFCIPGSLTKHAIGDDEEMPTTV